MLKSAFANVFSLRYQSFRRRDRLSSSLIQLLQQVEDGKVSAAQASKLISDGYSQTNDELLSSFANLDHSRSMRAGFPEAVFAEGKTPNQVAQILEDMARSLNENPSDTSVGSMIMATR